MSAASYQGKRVVFVAEGAVDILGRDETKPAAGQVLLENVASLVSAGTALARLYNTHSVSRPYPQNTGYASVGRVLEVGPAVTGLEQA